VIPGHDWFPRELPANVRIGERSWLYSSFALLHCVSRRQGAVRIGNDSGIYQGTFFELGPRGEVWIGDYCSIVGATICVNSRVEIGDYALIAHEVVIADSHWSVPPPGTFGVEGAAADGPEEPPAIVVGRNAWVGARAVLLRGCELGEGAIVGAGAVVDFRVPPYAIVAGNPARIVGWATPKDGGGKG